MSLEGAFALVIENSRTLFEEEMGRWKRFCDDALAGGNWVWWVLLFPLLLLLLLFSSFQYRAGGNVNGIEESGFIGKCECVSCFGLWNAFRVPVQLKRAAVVISKFFVKREDSAEFGRYF